MSHGPEIDPDKPIEAELDSWHRHGADEEKPQHAHAERVNVVVVGGIGFLIFLSIVATVVVVRQYYAAYTVQLLKERQLQVKVEKDAVAAKETALANLNAPQFSWADAEKGLVKIPIDKAVPRVVEQYKSIKR
ncbi:MAG: hypothetical protein JNM07_02450 [Phycisphaerae bacterium]|nr:hypothetical protein [Phycisphaerae bacterium]